MKFKNILNEVTLQKVFDDIKKNPKAAKVYFKKSLNVGFNTKGSTFANQVQYAGGIKDKNGKDISSNFSMRVLKKYLSNDQFNDIKDDVKLYLDAAEKAGSPKLKK